MGFQDGGACQDGGALQEVYDGLLARWGVEVEPLSVRSEFGTTRVNACGPADAPPVVLLPGHGATSAVWFTVAPRLASQYRVYAVDLIVDAGLGVPSGPAPRTPADLHIWLSGVLTGLGVEHGALVGHSYGAWVALTYAIAHPERVRRLALLDPTDCYLGLRVPYVARALPSLLRPSAGRVQSFLRWETQGVTLDPLVLELAGLAAVEPAPPVVRPKRPTAGELRPLAPLVFVANRSKCHNTARLTRRITTLSPNATVVPLRTATHHSLPTLHTSDLLPPLLTHLSAE
ncbi:alpha/beta fold hydrolase [Kribbella sp. NPDC048915]|uniref:alpha/beta fold hydrolase n=1 Tax=Kribbella sp. NPDC048915 TaxID=3155148 RepID=UPI0033F1353D